MKTVVLLISLALVGCQSPFVRDTNKEPLLLSPPAKPKLYPVYIEAKELPDGNSAITLSEASYKNWLRNNKNLERYILQSYQVIMQYRKYYNRETVNDNTVSLQSQSY